MIFLTQLYTNEKNALIYLFFNLLDLFLKKCYNAEKGGNAMQEKIQSKLRQLGIRDHSFLMVVDFAGTLFALGPDKDHIKDDYLPKDAEYLSGKRAIKGAIELDPVGCQNEELKPFQGGIRYGWTVIPSVAQLLRDVKGINVVASSVADNDEQVALQKQAYKDNHIHIDHILTKKAKKVVRKGYHPSTIVVLGDTSSDVRLAKEIAGKMEKISPHTKVICGFTPSGMEQHQAVKDVLKEAHQNIEFISGENWSIVISKLRKRLPIRSQHLHQLKKIRKQKGHIKMQNFGSFKQNKR